jgi:hypothetical protein
MKIIFYSDKCEYCKKMFIYLEKHNILSIFKLINIDNNNYPDIDIVPTIVDSELLEPMKGNKAFEYLLSIKYFNNPTNNIDYINQLPPNPKIVEDEKANKGTNNNLEIIENKEPIKPNNNMQKLLSNLRGY